MVSYVNIFSIGKLLFLLNVNNLRTEILCRCVTRSWLCKIKYVFLVFWFLDIDECLNGDSLCEHGQCTNKAGSYECQCEIGYIPAEDRKSCVGKTTA